MAVAFVQAIGTGTPADSQNPAVTTTATAVVGERIVVCFGCFDNVTVNTVSDSAGNTYAVDVQAYSGVKIAIASAPVTTQLSSSGTITVNLSATASWLNIHAATYSGVATSSAVDTTNTLPDDDENMATTATSSSMADAVIVGCFVMRSGTDWTWTAGGSATKNSETKGGNVNFASQRRVLTVSGSYNSSGSWSGTDNLDGICGHVIYKGISGAADNQLAWVTA